MKKRPSEEQIIRILQEAETGVVARDLCRKYSISEHGSVNTLLYRHTPMGPARLATLPSHDVAWIDLRPYRVRYKYGLAAPALFSSSRRVCRATPVCDRVRLLSRARSQHSETSSNCEVRVYESATSPRVGEKTSAKVHTRVSTWPSADDTGESTHNSHRSIGA